MIPVPTESSSRLCCANSNTNVQERVFWTGEKDPLIGRSQEERARLARDDWTSLVNWALQNERDDCWGQTQNGTGADNKEQIKTMDNAGIRKNGVNSQHTYLG